MSPPSERKRVFEYRERLVETCRRYHVSKLSIFGSALRQDFRADSDVDVLVEFEPDWVPGLVRLQRMEEELAPLFGNHKVDLQTPKSISRFFRDRVVKEAVVQYEG